MLRLADGTVLPLSGHSDRITSMTSSPDGRYLAIASADGTAQVWDAATGKLVSTLGGNGSPALTSVGFSPNGRLVLTADNKGFVRVWDAGIGEPAAELAAPAHGTVVVSLGFTSSGSQVSGIDVDTSTGTNAAITSVAALTWSARTGQLERSLPLPGIAPTAVPCSAALRALGNPVASPLTGLPSATAAAPGAIGPGHQAVRDRVRRRLHRTRCLRWRRARMAQMSRTLARTRSSCWTPAGGRLPPCRWTVVRPASRSAQGPMT